MDDVKSATGREIDRLQKSYEDIFGYPQRDSVTGHDGKYFQIFDLNPPRRMNYSATTKVR